MDEDVEVDLTPLIDVTFLLLIFFMVTANMAEPTTVRLPRSKTGIGETTGDKILIHIHRGDEETKCLRVGSNEAEARPISELKIIAASFPAGTPALIRADRDVKFRYVNDIADQLRGFGVNKVKLGVREGAAKEKSQ